ncbi:membrane protein [Zunongwangia profunda SM-A87]|uniref:Membrane protein n=1 Tax=Zunongwangia profunda (strain DSM 18752 / CCTCC AB 206139 / SM-A87) TaxID=655815 RepID=D5BFS6_ZUNPS|nr:exosortase family protein XrtF [Zunongwangia profunda]ADF51020.1 membrane protein [Zunongwangia profunda SM-A87]
MFQLFKKYSVVIRFVAVFLGSYFLLSVLYNAYLIFSETRTKFYPDFFTNIVSRQSAAIMEFLGYSIKLQAHQTQNAVQVFIEDTLLVRVVEGCNSISVIILFTSFILSFFAKKRTTFFYILAGSVFIYAMNLIRIALLTIAIYKYPEYTSLMHDIVFPLIIYGTVIILWVFWVRVYANLEKNESQV